MTWIESHVLLRTNTKLINLCNELKITRAQAIGHLHMLWWWAIENREDGNLSGLFDRDIAGACDWDGDAKQLIDALHKCGWLIEYHINDWEQYVGKILGGRERARKYRDRHVSVTLPVTSPSALTIYNTQDNKHNIQEKPLVSITETHFKDVWTKYPLKTGVSKALANFKKTVKNLDDLDRIKNCLEIYLRHLASNSWKKPQNGSTWFRNWSDWEGFSEDSSDRKPRKQVL